MIAEGNIIMLQKLCKNILSVKPNPVFFYLLKHGLQKILLYVIDIKMNW